LTTANGQMMDTLSEHRIYAPQSYIDGTRPRGRPIIVDAGQTTLHPGVDWYDNSGMSAE